MWFEGNQVPEELENLKEICHNNDSDDEEQRAMMTTYHQTSKFDHVHSSL